MFEAAAAPSSSALSPALRHWIAVGLFCRMRRDLCGHRQGQRAGGICGARLGAQPRPRFGTQAARALLSGPAGSSEQAVGLSSRRWHALPLLGGGGGSAHAARPPQRLPLQTLERHLRVMTSNPVASYAGSALEAHLTHRRARRFGRCRGKAPHPHSVLGSLEARRAHVRGRGSSRRA